MNTSRDSESGAFARRINELREASGRSYGALARRVGVSASTLHRYCSGHTVPMEFAPVERLARLCGLGGEDLVALHRLWILADADRRRRQEAGGSGVATGPAAEAGPAAGAGPAAEAGPAVQGDPGDPSDISGRPHPSSPSGHQDHLGHRDRADRPDHADPPDSGGLAHPAAPVTGADSRPGEPTDTIRSSHDGPERDGGARPEVTVVLGEGRGAGAPPAGRRPAGTTRPPRRRRRLVYGAGAVATALTFVLLPAFDHSPLRPADGRRAAAQQPGTGTVGGSPTSGARGTSSAGPVSPSASPSGTRTTAPAPGGGPETPGAAPPRSTGAPKSPAAGSPFTVRVNQHVWANGCDHGYLVDRRPDAVPPPPGEADAAPWARAVGAVHGGRTGVRITVQGRTDEAVVLQSLRVRVAARRAPAPGNAYQMSLGCGGSLTPRMFDVDLDKSRPIARSVGGYDENGPLPAVAFPYRVSAEDPEILLVTATTAGCGCDWYLELEWSSGDRSGTVRVDDDGGRPFRTSAVGGRTSYVYDTGTGRWITGGPSPRAETGTGTGTGAGTRTGTGTGTGTRTGDGGDTEARPEVPAS
ncbi:helix-turn-helix domain-containing protein [Streptomyces sp. NPDC051018]|uniref:helix-turn-helix domain-containing protein n=1 Tax=Streptomyces sp. NPDC051018 TaxID=3365639 RepID=UPI003789C9A2